uniref:Molybdopterin synthase catalytic subunit n=1 Tax=Panagrolaimus sp. ES5 TaxID=591445 RepID=A0AC34GC97_9BILA
MAEFIKKLSNENDVIIVEGNMLCELKSLENNFDEIIFFTMTKEECEKRRSTRRYDPADKPGYFDQIVWPCYEQHFTNALKRNGTTRDNFNNKKVQLLEYECYEGMAYSEMKNVCSKTRQKFPEIKRIAIFHRIGKVDIGEASVIISTSSPHRRESIEATHFAIDILKETVPIFKKEIYEDGTKSWKENVEFDKFKE